jgi:hypothetical protein
MRVTSLVVLGLIFLISLTGCLYPKGERFENQLVLEQNVSSVQDAVDAFREKKGTLPIHTTDPDTPPYQKYVVDFSQLRSYLPHIPANSFEEGGTHMYVIMNAEEDPTVKLFDLQASQMIGELKMIMSFYWQEFGEYPLGNHIEDRYYTFDFKKVNSEEMKYKSPYSGNYLPFIIDKKTGWIGIDYSIDMGRIAQEKGLTEWDERTDLRIIFIENSYFVPAYSFPYYFRDGEPALSRQK